MTDLKSVYESMITHMIAFLRDDCYAYIMTVGLTAYNKVSGTGDFVSFNFGLSGPFHEKMITIYRNMEAENPESMLNKNYRDVVFNAIYRIQREDHPFAIGVNANVNGTYDVVFLKKKKIEPTHNNGALMQLIEHK